MKQPNRTAESVENHSEAPDQDPNLETLALFAEQIDRRTRCSLSTAAETHDSPCRENRASETPSQKGSSPK